MLSCLQQISVPSAPFETCYHGCFRRADYLHRSKKAQEVHLESCKKVVLEHWASFGRAFNRHYLPIECYRCDDAETMLLTMGSFSETAMTAVDKLRTQGKKIGLVRIRLWRPFPFEEFRQAVSQAKH